MLKKRIIPCLDIQSGRTVKGINFESIRDAGDPVTLAKKYSLDGADELIFLDITATNEKRKTLSELVERIALEINIPFTVGGGINSIDDVSALLSAGADKVSVNSSAVKNPNLLREISSRFGSQCLVLAIDTKNVDGIWKVFTNGGKVETNLTALDWALEGTACGAGEILLTSMNNDGTKSGFSIEVTREISECVDVPVIASGGAGDCEDFSRLFKETKATGGLAASIFHYGEITIPELKDYLRNDKIEIR